jgi:hypothetical protein
MIVIKKLSHHKHLLFFPSQGGLSHNDFVWTSTLTRIECVEAASHLKDEAIGCSKRRIQALQKNAHRIT